MHYTSVERSFETNCLLNRITIYFEFFSGLRNSAFHQIGIIQSSCRHSNVTNDRVAKADCRIYQHPIGIWVWYPMTGNVINVKYAIKQGLPDDRLHLEVVIHQIQNTQLFVGFSRLHEDSLAIRTEALVHREWMVDIMPLPKLNGDFPYRLRTEPSREMSDKFGLDQIKKA